MYGYSHLATLTLSAVVSRFVIFNSFLQPTRIARARPDTMAEFDLEQPMLPDLNESLAELEWPEAGSSKMPAPPNLYPKAVAAMTGAMATSLLSGLRWSNL